MIKVIQWNKNMNVYIEQNVNIKQIRITINLKVTYCNIQKKELEKKEEA